MKKGLLPFVATIAMLYVVCLLASAQKNEYRIIDHVVYQLIPSSKNESAHYEIISLFDSEEAMKGKTRITIPSQIDGIKVTAISCDKNHVDSYFDSVVETVTLPKTIKSIGRDAFSMMRNLTKINIPESVTTIERSAFCYCNSLTQINIPKSVQIIGANSFYNCSNLKQVHVFGNKLKVIGPSAFSKCEKLQSISLPTSLKAIKRQAFFRAGLKSVRIPGNCVVEGEAFLYNNSLKTLILDNRIDENNSFIQSYAFGYCTSLTKVYLPKESIDFQIPAAAFEGCTKLKAVYRTNHIQSIGYHAFYKCKALSSFTVPAGIQSIHKFAFSDCNGLRKIRILTTNSSFLSRNAAFLQTLPDACRIYVKTEKMKQTFLDAGCQNPVIVKADLE